MAEKNNNLTQKIYNLIAENGPISIAQFMQLTLFEPNYGYYNLKNPFGESGDFITSPEISQIFTEIIASYAIYNWQKLGKPKSFQIIELGSGNGTLINDFLLVAQKHTDFYKAISIHLVEASDRLKKIQKNLLNKYSVSIKHYSYFSQIPHAQSFIIANEFFDCLPIYQFIYQNEQWYERMVGITANKLSFIAVKCGIQANNIVSLIQEPYPPKNGDIYEISPISINIMDEICNYLNKTNSMAIFIDYGYIKKAYGDSLQAIKKHQYHPILEQIGMADLTIHVDFASFVQIINKHPKLKYILTNQREFLISHGILQRTEQLMQVNQETSSKKVVQATNRLIDKRQMGELFKVLVVNKEIN
jgi:NADH dehydrogenase [ubiquinone] 1 alpha subcomplex assembly factor 7